MFTCLGQNSQNMVGFRIELESSPNFSPGQTITGQVVLTNINPKELKCILLSFLGKAKVHWSVPSGRSAKHYIEKEIYFKDETLLDGNVPSETESITLPPGRHIYSFVYTLPPGIPSSFSHPLGKVTYSIEAVIKRPWYKLDQTTRLPFKVQANLNLNPNHLPSLLSAPAAAHSDKYFYSCVPPKMQHVSFTLHLTKRGFLPGESIPFKAHIYNTSGYELKPPRVKLVQVINFRAQGKTRTETCVVAKVKGQTRIGPGKMLEWVDQGALKVPLDDLDGCKIIDLLYILKLELKLWGLWKLRLKASCQIQLAIPTQLTIDYGNADAGFGTQVYPQTVANNPNRNRQIFGSPQSEDYRDPLDPSAFNRAFNSARALLLNPDYSPNSPTHNPDHDNDDNEALPSYEDAIQMQRFPKVNYSYF